MSSAAGDSTHYDIAIIGGGMVGATLALLLSKALPEKRIVVLEAKKVEPEALSLPSFDARSTAIAPSTYDILAKLSLAEDIAPYATAIRHVHVSDRGQPGMLRISGEDNQQKPLGFVVENRGLGRALLSRVEQSENIHMRAPALVDQLQFMSDCVHVRTEDKSLHASLVVIADGADSPLRKQLGIAEQVKDYQQVAVVTNVAYEKQHQGVAFERFTESGPLALLPIGGEGANISTLVWTWPENEKDKPLAMSDEAFLQCLQQRFGYRLGRFKKVGQRFVYPLKLMLASEQVRSRVVLMGNAAHFLHPVAGQGFNLALRDCARLTEVLRNNSSQIGHLSTLQQYEKAQLQDQHRTVFLSNSFNQLFLQKNPLLKRARNVGFMALGLSSMARSAFIQQLAGKSQSRARPFS